MESGVAKYTCSECLQDVTVSSDSLFNLKRHLKRHHARKYEEWQNEFMKVEANMKQTKLTVSSSGTIKVPLVSKEKKVALDVALTQMVCQDGLPHTIVAKKGFLRFIKVAVPGYAPPTYETLRTSRIPALYSELKEKVKTELSRCESVSVTMDIWSSSNLSSFLGVTVSCVSIDFKPKMFHIACREMTSRHTGENILDLFTDIAEEFGIQNKILRAVVDNAGNMGRMGDLWLENNEKLEDDEFESEDEEGEEQEESGDEVTFAHLCQQPWATKCLAHTIQLVVKDGFRSTSSFETTISKAKKFVNSVRKSTIDQPRVREAVGFSLTPAVPTRWNSTLRMIKSVVRLMRTSPDLVSELSVVKKDHKMKLTPSEIRILESIIECLEPLAEATDRLQAEAETAGQVLPLLRLLQQRLAEVEKHQIAPPGLVTFAAEMGKSLARRTEAYWKDPVFITAAVLDPRFKTSFMNNKAEIDELKAVVEKYLTANDSTTCSSPVLSARSKEATVTETPSLFDDLPDLEESSTTGTVHDELQKYLNERRVARSDSPLAFWRNREASPKLTAVAKKVFGVPATSGSSERLFSTAGYLSRSLRNRIGARLLEQKMFIKRNIDLV